MYEEYTYSFVYGLKKGGWQICKTISLRRLKDNVDTECRLPFKLACFFFFFFNKCARKGEKLFNKRRQIRGIS